MLTLRIIFVGLIAVLSNPGETGQKTAVLIDDDHHRSVAILLEGTCTGGDCQHGTVSLSPGARQKFDPALLWELDGLDLRFEGLSQGRVGELTGLRGVDGSGKPVTGPGLASEVPDVSWVPHLGRLTGMEVDDDCFQGFGDGGGEGCPSNARFLLGAGMMSNCHMAHTAFGGPPTVQRDCRSPSGTPAGFAAQVPTYTIGPNYEQAMGNVVLVEVNLHRDEVTLEGAAAGQQGESLRARLAPSQGAAPVVTLVVMNEPMAVTSLAEMGLVELGLEEAGESDPMERHWESMTAQTHGAPAEREHFARFRDLLNASGDPGDIRDPLIPRRSPAATRVSPGVCEPYLRCLDALFYTQPINDLFDDPAPEDEYFMLNAPHGPGECDAVTG